MLFHCMVLSECRWWAWIVLPLINCRCGMLHVNEILSLWDIIYPVKETFRQSLTKSYICEENIGMLSPFWMQALRKSGRILSLVLVLLSTYDTLFMARSIGYGTIPCLSYEYHLPTADIRLFSPHRTRPGWPGQHRYLHNYLGTYRHWYLGN